MIREFFSIYIKFQLHLVTTKKCIKVPSNIVLSVGWKCFMINLGAFGLQNTIVIHQDFLELKSIWSFVISIFVALNLIMSNDFSVEIEVIYGDCDTLLGAVDDWGPVDGHRHVLLRKKSFQSVEKLAFFIFNSIFSLLLWLYDSGLNLRRVQQIFELWSILIQFWRVKKNFLAFLLEFQKGHQTDTFPRSLI